MKFQLLLLAVALFGVLALVESSPLPRQYCWGEECINESEYCRRPEGMCNSEGYCVPMPTDCAGEDPVCACNGETFENHCAAAAAGHSVAYEGACSRK